MGRYLDDVTEQWLLVAPLANPAMLEMFADRDSLPYRNLVPWSGEFAGKYLTAAVQVCALTRDPRLQSLSGGFRRAAGRAPGRGRLPGSLARDSRLTNFSPHHGNARAAHLGHLGALPPDDRPAALARGDRRRQPRWTAPAGSAT